METQWYEPMLSGLDTVYVHIDLTKNVHNKRIADLVVLGIPITYKNELFD